MAKAKAIEKRKKQDLTSSSDSVTVQTNEENGKPSAKPKKKRTDSSAQVEENSPQSIEDES